MVEARESIASLKALHGRMAEGGFIVSLSMPALAGEVIEVQADRAGDRLGIRDLWWLADLPEDQRLGALDLLRVGCAVESLAVDRPVVVPVRRSRRSVLS